MDTTTLIILGVIVLLAIYLFNRNRVRPRGTYDNEDYRSSGSIGGGPAYDDEDYRSSGSIGGSSQRDYDSPDFDSGGSIGGQRRQTESRPVSTDGNSDWPRHDSRDFGSGGSIGGSSSSRGSSARDDAPSSPPRKSGSRPPLRDKDAKDE